MWQPYLTKQYGVPPERLNLYILMLLLAMGVCARVRACSIPRFDGEHNTGPSWSWTEAGRSVQNGWLPVGVIACCFQLSWSDACSLPSRNSLSRHDARWGERKKLALNVTIVYDVKDVVKFYFRFYWEIFCTWFSYRLKLCFTVDKWHRDSTLCTFSLTRVGREGSEEPSRTFQTIAMP
jgi:hypothetical protein